ncbi:MAG: hypothetical protein KIT84_09805 [Labilithrix sp.]|nr:hypothetical protein [Labilithrix sp.]MCW5811296.1 hypothetical protein [Labilithrix sp.]
MNRPPGGSTRPPQLSRPPPDRNQLQARVRAQFGSIVGSMPSLGRPTQELGPQFDERELLQDDYLKTTVRLIAFVFGLSLFAWIATSTTFDAPGIWANSFRFDTALVVVWGPLLIWALRRLRVKNAVRIYLVLALFIEPFSETMMKGQGDGYWDSYMWPAAVAYYGTIKEWSGMPGASLPVFFFVTVGLLYRAVWGKKSGDYIAPPKWSRTIYFVFMGGVLALCVWGLIHGGSFQSEVRQVLHLFQLPIIGLLFLYALRVPEDVPAIGTIFVATAMLRGVLVLWIYFGVFVPAGITQRPGHPEWCTTHSDSVLFVMGILIVVLHAFEQRTKRTIYRAIGISAFLLLAMAFNNRRLAFVSLAIAPAAIYIALKPSKRKRRVTTALAIGIPLLLGYVLVGSEINSPSPLLKPAKLVMSVLEQKDTSSQSRDIENENLIYTLRENVLVPTGFGSEYQYSPNNPPVDLTDVFVNYRLIAHNGVLWLWSLGGVVGFTVLWLIFPITGTLALRAYRSAPTALERSAALTSFGSVAVCIVQIWGDQGANGYMTPVTIAVSYAIATRLAMRTA